MDSALSNAGALMSVMRTEAPSRSMRMTVWRPTPLEDEEILVRMH
jgi:hypothetical protein